MKYDLVTIEGILACVTLAIIVIQLVVSLFAGGIDADVDIDGDADADFDLSGLLTPKGILQFICGFAWYMVLIKPEHGGGWYWYDWAIGAAIGLAVMILMALLYWGMNKLTHIPKYEQGEDLINRAGTITYKDASNPGVYGFMTTIDAMQKEIVVKSKSGNATLQAGDSAVIIESDGQNYFID